MNFPLEYRAELLGEYAERVESQQRLRIFIVAALILIFLLLQAAFRSWKLAFAIFFTIPMALIGGIAANYIVFGNSLSLGALIGFITVIGITVRSTIILVKHYRHLEKVEGETFGPALIQMGTRTRLIPVIITNVTVLLAFIPLVVFGKVPGLEIIHPIAVVVLGGIITSALYSLIAVPAVYSLFGADHEPDIDLNTIVPEFEE